jgi:hypothetical protein
MVNQTRSYLWSETWSQIRSPTHTNTWPKDTNQKNLRPKIWDFSIEFHETFIDTKAKEIKYALNKWGEVDLLALKALLRRHLTEKYQEIRETNWTYRQRHQVIIQEWVTYFSFEINGKLQEYVTKTLLFEDQVFQHIKFEKLFPKEWHNNINNRLISILSKGKLKKKVTVRPQKIEENSWENLVREFDLRPYWKKI